MAAAPYRDAVRPGSVAAVVGCGAMGRGIAELLARAGLEVRLFDSQPGAADAARTAVGASLDKLVAGAKISAVKIGRAHV